MKVVTRQVYYCEHCKRHRLTAKAIQDHEPRCIYNPERTVCGWHHGEPPASAIAPLAAELRQSLDIDPVREAMDGCPACILSVVVQANMTSNERGDLGWMYADEVERFRKAENVDQMVY